MGSSGCMPANMLSISPSGSFNPRRRPNFSSNSSSVSSPVSRPRRSARASGSVRKSFLIVSGSSPSPRRKAAKLSQTDVVRTPPKSKRTAAYAPVGMEQQATQDVPEGIDGPGVEAWFEANVPGAEPPLGFERISGRRSNLTFDVHDSAGHSWALRRPPLGKRLGSAHDMGREHRVIAALQETPVPVPPVAGLCEDDSVNGAPFYVMGFVEGPILRSAEEAERFGEPERRAIGDRVVDTLVAIHEVDPDAVGLGDLGRKEGYIERQLRRWHGQWEKSKTRELPAIDEVHDRLRERIPEQGPAAIVHGDYRLDNTIVSASGDLLAVLDWELCTLGDPLADVGLLVVYWSRPYGVGPTAAEGFPPVEELVARYAECSGRDLSRLAFYEAFSAWRIAVILEGVYSRTRAGAYGDRGGTDGLPEAVEGLAQRAAGAVL